MKIIRPQPINNVTLLSSSLSEADYAAWEKNTSYSYRSVSVTAQETSPRGLAFSADGTKAYVVGSTNKTVYQYTLSTAWDIATAVYASKSLSVNAQETQPEGLAFSSDGTKAYIIGSANKTIYQYTLSTAWDISTGAYATKSMSANAQETVTLDLAFSSDGTKAYVVGTTADTIFQYTLSTPWDISTGSYASKSMSVAAQEASPHGLFFSADGTKAYILGQINDTIYQYTLSTPWDISTGSYAGKSFSVTAQEIDPAAIAFSADGTRAYIVGGFTDTIYQYSVSTAWNLTPPTYGVGDRRILVSPSDLIACTIGSPCTITWAAHGLANDTPVMFTTTGTLPTGITAGTVYYVRNRDTHTFELSLKKSGAAVNTSGSQSGTHTGTAQVHHVYESLQANNVGHYPLISPTWWLLISATNRWAMFDQTISAPSANPESITVVLQGVGLSNAVELLNVYAERARFVQSASDGGVIFTITIATPAVVSSASHGLPNGTALTLETTGALPTGLTPLSGVYYVVNAAASTFELALTPGGASIATSGTQSGTHLYSLVTYDTTYDLIVNTGLDNWDISTAAAENKNFIVTSQDTAPTDFAFHPDGTKFFVAGNTTDTIYQYTLTTAWDINSASYAGKSLLVSGQTTAPAGLAFSADGTKAYVMGSATDIIYQYTLATPWDLSTGSYASKSLSVTAQASAPYGLAFSADGTRVYVSDQVSKVVYQYTLATPWDLSTGSYASKSLSVTGFGINVYGLALSADGTNLYVASGTARSVQQYTLSTAWDISTGVFSNKRMFAAAIEISPKGIAIKPDGSKLLLIGTASNRIIPYLLGENWHTSDFGELDLPAYTNARLIVILTAPGENVQCGELIFGQKLEFGDTEYGARTGIKDYSVKQRDDFGNFTVVERNYSKRATFMVVMDNAYIDYLQKLLADFRATPIVYIGSDGYTSTHVLGFYIDFSVEIAYPTTSLCSIEVESLT